MSVRLAETPGERRLAAALRLRAFERLRPSQWVEKHIRLPGGYSETEAGRVNFGRSPYLREIIDTVREPGVQDVFFVGPTRIGKTLVLRCVWAYCIAGDPGPTLLVDSTMPKARSLVRKELIPLVNHNPVLRERKPTGKDRHDFSTSQMLFPGAAFNCYGANSDKQIAGDTFRRVLGNEVVRWRGGTDREAATLELVRHRTESFDDDRRHLFSGTPELEDDIFWQEAIRGDMRHWFVPCPSCGYMQDLLWQDEQGRYRVVWGIEAGQEDARSADGSWDLARVAATARYRCANPTCSDPFWTDVERLKAIEDPRAEWRPTKKADPLYRSYHLDGLYGRRKVNRIGSLATLFLGARDTGFIKDRQDFWNSNMGMVWLDTVESITLKRLSFLERPYDRGKVPEGFQADIILVGFDVQSWGLPYVVRAGKWSGELYLVDHGTAATWGDLDQVQADYTDLARGKLSYVIGDINYEERAAEAKEQIWQRRDRNWMAADGVEFSRDRVSVRRANVFEGGEKQRLRITIPRLVISTYDFKLEIEKRLAGHLGNWWLYSLPAGAADTEAAEFAEYKTQLLDERRRPRKRRRKGLPPMEFVARNKNNHAFDCEVYLLALFWVLQKKKSFRRRRAGERQVMEVKQ